MINYITTESVQSSSGGWSGINLRLYQELKKNHEINYIGPVNPSSNPFEKFYSKIRRITGKKGDFHFYSENRLRKIAEIVESRREKNATYNFFFGNTPWLKINPEAPYGVYLDASFPTYLNLYSKPEAFDESDIKRISDQERYWLKNATHLFFGSNWAREEAFKHLDFTHKNSHVVCTGGNVPIPCNDNFEGNFNFLFISLNFHKKGGVLCWEAFKDLRESFPSARLQVIGEQPPQNILDTPGVHYLGKLDKNNPEDLRLLTETLSKAFFLIHPTTMDTMGAVIVEAGYYGCPSIAPKSFGIPDLIKDKETGILLDLPLKKEQISEEIIFYLQNHQRYQEMRTKVRKFTMQNYSWNAIGEKISQTIATGV